MVKNEKISARKWFSLGLLLLPTAIMTVDLGVLWMATPALTAQLQPTSAELLWINDVYGFVIAGFLVVMGVLGDKVGRRKVLMVGMALFILSSVLAAFAQTATMLIAARALLGITGAAILPSTLSLIRHLFDDEAQRTKAIAMWVTALSVGVALGPILGGLMLQHFHWGSVFLLGIPIMLFSLLFARIFLPEYKDPKAGKVDLVSAAMFLVAMLSVVYTIKHLAEAGPDATTIAITIIALFMGALFTRRQKRLAHPLFDLYLFKNHRFTMALILLLLGLMALNGVEYLVPQFFQFVYVQSPLATSLLLLPGAAALVAGSQLTPRAASRWGSITTIITGLLVALVGYGLLIAGSYGTNVVWIATGFATIMFGIAPITVLGTAMVIGQVAPEKAGAAAALGQTSYELGLAAGIALTGSLSVAVYRSYIDTHLTMPLPPEAVVAAKDTAGGALGVAQSLQGSVSSEYIRIVTSAFSVSFRVAVIASIVIVVSLGIFLLIRRRSLKEV